jgi:putative ABC transport system ATP-binding protein
LTAVLQLEDVRKVYRARGPRPPHRKAPRPALDGVSLTVEAGEVVALLGPSGSGKSSLLNLAAGLDDATGGMVIVTGQDLATLGESGRARFRRQRIGVVFQAFHLLPSLTALDNVLVPARLAGVDRRVAGRRAEELLEQLGVADLAGALPNQLSGGEQQRVAIARALVNRPSLVLADEPTGALDSTAANEVMGLLAEVGRDGQAVVVATHDAELAARHLPRVVRLLDGRVVEDVELAPQLSVHVAAPAPSANGHHPTAGVVRG